MFPVGKSSDYLGCILLLRDSVACHDVFII